MIDTDMLVDTPFIGCTSHHTDVDLRKLAEEDLYTRYKMLQKQLELLEIQEEYIKEETKNLKTQYVRAKEEIKVIQSTPLVIGQFNEMIDENY